MSTTTSIGWCHATLNKVIGCTRVSEGCRLCYAEKMDDQRFSKTLGGGTKANPIGHWGPGAPRHVCAGFDDGLRSWNRNPPKDWNLQPGERARVFVNSLSDWLDEEWPVQVLSDFLFTICHCPNLDILASTKRPENWRPRVEAVYTLESRKTPEAVTGLHEHVYFCTWLARWLGLHADIRRKINGEAAVIPPPNFWFITTVENQKAADKRLPEILQVPAVVRGLSVEPLVGKLDLAYASFNGADSFGTMPGIHWTIVGGESGDGFHEMDLAGFVRVCMDTVRAGVPLFVKQDSGRKSGQQGRISDAWWAYKQFPERTAA